MKRVGINDLILWGHGKKFQHGVEICQFSDREQDGLFTQGAIFKGPLSGPMIRISMLSPGIFLMKKQEED